MCESQRFVYMDILQHVEIRLQSIEKAFTEVSTVREELSINSNLVHLTK